MTDKALTGRRAFVCYDKDKTIHKRVFLLPGENLEPRCDTHGKMVPQPNKTYRKKGVAPHD